MSTEAVPAGRFLTGSLAGFLAGHILNFGIVQFVLATLDSPAIAGIALFVAFGTPILLGLHAGAVCDRTPSIRVARGFQWGYVVGAAILIALAILEPGRTVVIAGVMAAAIGIGIGWSYVSPARLVYLAQLVPEDQLRGKTILFNVFSTIGFGLAPLALGLLSASTGWQGTFGTAIGLIVLAEFLFAGLPVIQPDGEHADSHWWASAKAGLKYIHRTPILLQLLTITMIVHILLGPIQVILPRLATEQLALGTVARGAFISMLAPLLIVGGLLALKLRTSPVEGRWMLAACLVSGIGMTSLGLATDLFVAIPLFAVFGIGGGVTVALLAAMLQVNCADEKRGRVMSMYAIATQFFPALGGLLSGITMARLAPAHALMAISGTIFVLLLVLLPWLKALTHVHE